MLKINYKSPTPIYEQLVDEIKKMIADGELKEGQPLPPIRTLANQIDVDKNTVVRAYQILANQGIVEGHGRKGSFVRGSIEDIPFESKKEFKDQIIKLLQRGLDKKEIEQIFYQNLNQIFD